MSATARTIDPQPAILQDSPRDPRGLGGLLARAQGQEQALPLAEVKVRASLAGDCARTVVEQRFENKLRTAMEAVHIFPLPERGAVTELQLRCGELTVQADCRERKEAQQRFEEARQAGQRAALLEAERDDVHTLRVTNLPPGEEVTVRIVVVERLEATDGQLRWRFPTTIAPRYLPGEPMGHKGPGVLPDSDRVPDASRLQPPLRLEGGTTLDLEVSVAGPCRSLASSLHAVRMDLDEGGVRVAPSGRASLDRDFALSFTTAEADRAGARAISDGSPTQVIVEPPSVELPQSLPRDAVFVVDISGSMHGGKMEAAKLALRSALHGLMPKDRFQLVAFDNRIERFAPDFTGYDERALARADRWVDALRARGGTEMLPAIRAALDGETPERRTRSVLFITDGQAWNEAELVAAVANRRQTARFHTLGIDTAVNASLLRKLADVGGGTCELTTPRDDIEAVVARLEARFGSPLVEEIVIEGHSAARLRPATLFAGRPASLLLEGAPEQLKIKGRGPSGPIAWQVEPQRVEQPLGALWARERIAALEERLTLKPFEEEALRPEILRIALEHGIASRFTAFVAVETSRSHEGERVELVQPAELPADWDERFRQPAAPAPRAATTLACAAAPASGQQIRRRVRRQRLGRSPRKALGAVMDAMMDAPRACAEEASPAPPPPAEAAACPADEDAWGGGASADPAGRLARSQGADGSFGGDLRRTAAALLALLLLGHTRRKGLRRRAVLKAARWLQGRRAQPAAALVLAALEAAERGEALTPSAELRALADGSAEGRVLLGLL